MTPTLLAAIEDVYAAFRDVPKPAVVEGCPCCMSPEELGVLLAKPLRELTPDDLTKYASSAFLTVGDVEDFLYLLPRILEILAADSYWWPSPEVVASALREADYHDWPAARREAVARYFDCILDGLLAEKGSGHALNTWVCALGRLRVDLAPILARITAHGPRLIEFYEANSQPLLKGRLGNSFWDHEPAEQRVVDWFQSADTRQRIEAQYGLA